jgi:chromosome segregation ATPase
MPAKKITLDERVLQRARISVLTLDERWNNLFAAIEKTPAIIKAEEALNNCVKEQARLTAESKDNQTDKKARLRRIMELTTEAFERENEAARAEITECEERVRAINAREPEIEREQGALAQKIKDSNVALLESAVAYLYVSMKKSQKRVAELDTMITDMRETLKDCISERELLDAAGTETYHFLHGLLGAAQIESLDEHYSLD